MFLMYLVIHEHFENSLKFHKISGDIFDFQDFRKGTHVPQQYIFSSSAPRVITKVLILIDFYTITQ